MSEFPRSRTRSKYTARACRECKRRKIKCSGDVPCRGCRNSIYRICTYDPKQITTTRYRLSTDQGTRLPAERRASTLRVANAQTSQPEHNDIPRLERSLEYSKAADMSEQQLSPFHAVPETVETCLQPDQELGRLLQCFFDELETFYPCFDRIDYYQRLSELFIKHTVRENGRTMISAKTTCLSLAALTCGMACLGAYLGGAALTRLPDDYYTAEAWRWHQESLRLLDQISLWREKPNMDLLRLHLTEVIYMIILQRDGEMSRVLAIAIDLAFPLKLHDEHAWLGLNARQQEHNRMLWWTICSIDRRIALLGSRPIQIRVADFVVGLPSSKSKSEWMSDSLNEALNFEPNDQMLFLQWPKPSDRSEAWFSYVLFTAQWSNVVAMIWDKFFGPRTMLHNNVMVEDIALADVLLLQLLTELPVNLLWDSVQLPSLMHLGEVDRGFRMRLLIFEAINTVRIRIRIGRSIQRCIEETGALVSDQEPLQTTDVIAFELIDAIALYLGARNCARPWSTYGSILLLRAAAQLSLVKIRDFTTSHRSSAEKERAVSSLETALDCLRGIDVKPAGDASEQFVILLQRAYHKSWWAVQMPISMGDVASDEPREDDL